MNLNDIVDEVYVVNLDNRQDRLDSVTKQFKGIKSKFTRVSATEREKGTQGNKLSWLKVFNNAINKKQEIIAICEDDVVFRYQLSKDLPRLAALIKKTDFDVLCFHHHCNDRSRAEKECNNPETIEVKLIRVKEKPYCNQFLIFKNLTIWRNQLICTTTKEKHLRRSLDSTLTQFGDKSKPYITSKEYTFQLDDFSTLQNKKVIRFHQKKRYKDIFE